MQNLRTFSELFFCMYYITSCLYSTLCYCLQLRNIFSLHQWSKTIKSNKMQFFLTIEAFLSLVKFVKAGENNSYTELPVTLSSQFEGWKVSTFPWRSERLMNINVSFCLSCCVIRICPKLMWNDLRASCVTWLPFCFWKLLTILWPTSCFLAPSAREELNLVAAGRTPQRAGSVSDTENGTPETRPHQSGSAVLNTPLLLLLLRELWLHGPDRSSEVGPEEHPSVWRRSWESHHIWTELRFVFTGTSWT